MLLIDKKIKFDDYRLKFNDDERKFLEEHFFNLAFWYLANDSKKDEALFSTDINPSNVDLYERLLNVGTSYLQMFFDYKYLIEDYKVNFNGLKFSDCHLDLDIIKKRIPTLLKNNSEFFVLSNIFEIDCDNIKESTNHFIYSDKQGGLKFKFENEFNPLNMFSFLSHVKEESRYNQQTNAVKRILLNQKLDVFNYQFFFAFFIEEDVSIDQRDYPIIVETFEKFLCIYDRELVIQFFNRVAELIVQYHILKLIEYRFSIENELNILIKVDGPTKLIRDNFMFFYNFTEDIDQIMEILHSIAWRENKNGQLERLNKDDIRRIVQREFNKMV